ncbi:MAG: hypothetical protein HQL49_02565 [Gammaproteobacteria bacterium]|nr:hypothetical protein [Gammaproteobacteria bacterium]
MTIVPQRHTATILLAPLLLITLWLSGCSVNPPKNVDNACAIFNEKRDWYRYSYQVEEKYGVAIPLQLAFIRQESGFLYNARPPRQWLLGFIPWFRPSSAYGYAQIKDETWDWYRSKTSRYGDDRDHYGDAVNFIGWYVDVAHRNLKLAKDDVYNHYLAYHEGMGGYKQQSYRKKPWLEKVAKKVKTQSDRYREQLLGCEDKLDKSLRWWPF